MLRSLVICFTAISMLTFKEAYQKKSQPFLLKRFECVGQPYTYTTVEKCNVETHRQGFQFVNLVVNVDQPVSKLYITTDIYIKNRQSLTFVYGTTFEYCDFLMRNESRRNNPVAVLVYNYAKYNFPQILRPCPVLGCYNVSGLPVDRNLIPPFVTPGGYFASQRYFSKRNETLMHYQLHLKRFQCNGQPYEIAKLHYCQLETLRNGTQVVGVILEFLNSLQKVNVAGGLYIQYFRSRTPLLATTIEYCQQNKDIMSIENPSTKFALKYAQEHLPQLLTDCPIPKGKVFNVSGVRINDKLIPSIVIPGTYYVELRVYNRRNQTAFSGWLEADIK